MNNTDIIWDTITNSAKKKFDYSSFEKNFNELHENLADNLLYKIIAEFASNKSPEIISLEIFNQILMMGFMLDLEDIQNFIKDKDKVFKVEISATQKAVSLLKDGIKPSAVLISTKELLN